jgi:hypothetical protein
MNADLKPYKPDSATPFPKDLRFSALICGEPAVM